MPEQLTLTHCQEVQLQAPGPGTLIVSCATGPGRIDVLQPGQPPHAHVHVPPGGKVAVPGGPVVVHYHADPGAPTDVDVTFETV